MTRPNDAPPLDDDAPEVAPDASPTAASRLVAPDLASLPIAGITGRRMAIALGVLLAVWIVLMFARQVGDAAAASTHADALVVSNAEQASRVAALSRELQQIQRQGQRPMAGVVQEAHRRIEAKRIQHPHHRMSK